MKPSFYAQCAASAEQLARIAQLEGILSDIYTLHKNAMGVDGKSITAAQHAGIVLRLTPYVDTGNNGG